MTCLTSKYQLRCYTIFLMLLSGASCSSEKFEPLFEGLAGGLGYEDSCTSFKQNSVRIKYQDMDYSFEVFSGANCIANQRLVNDRLPAYAMLAGEWRGLIVIDNGTGSDSRSFSLFDPVQKANVSEFDYADRPVFGKKKIDFYVSTGVAGDAESCSSQKEEYEEWKRFQFGVEVAIKKSYSAESSKVTTLSDKKCIPIE